MYPTSSFQLDEVTIQPKFEAMLMAFHVLRPVDSCGVQWSESRLSVGGVKPGSRFAGVAGVDSATVPLTVLPRHKLYPIVFLRQSMPRP